MNNNKSIFILGTLFLSLNTTVFADTLKLDTPKKAPKEDKTYSLDGNFIISDSIDGGEPYISALATWKPDSKNYWFVRGTARHNFDNDDSGFRYTWGLGYDDWHTGTWSVQLNNYEPLKIGDGLGIETAIASVGYKFDSQFLKNNKLRSEVTLSKEIEGDTKFSTTLQWNPSSYWFVRGIMIVPLEGDGDVTYNYVFGYDDWHPGAFGIEYSNYEENPLGESNFRDGKLALTYKWKFK